MGRVSNEVQPAEVIGSAGGGAVRVRMQAQRVASVEIDPELLQEPETLAELVAAAVNDALGTARAQAQEAAERLVQRLAGGASI